MPTYEYRCQYCHELVEAFQRMSDTPLIVCPHCGKEGLSRVVSGGAGVIYKGEGWYVTDYSKKSSGGKETDTGKEKPDGAKEKSSSPETKPAGSEIKSAETSPAPSPPSKETKSSPATKTGTD
jgi:putative FmdB family regulatory protein